MLTHCRTGRGIHIALRSSHPRSRLDLLSQWTQSSLRNKLRLVNIIRDGVRERDTRPPREATEERIRESRQLLTDTKAMSVCPNRECQPEIQCDTTGEHDTT